MKAPLTILAVILAAGCNADPAPLANSEPAPPPFRIDSTPDLRDDAGLSDDTASPDAPAAPSDPTCVCPLDAASEFEKMTRWLVFHQAPDGRFSATEYADACGTAPCPGTAEHDDAGTTGLALLALYAHGDFPNALGPERPAPRALECLVSMRQPDGWLASSRDDVEAHAQATLALVEAYGVSARPRWKQEAEASLAALDAKLAQRFELPKSTWSTDELAWTAFALKSARMCELSISSTNRAALVSAVRERSRDRGAKLPERAKLAAAAWMLGETTASSPDLAATIVALREAELVHDDAFDPELAYFGAEAMFQAGGRDWVLWRTQLMSLRRLRVGAPPSGSPQAHHPCGSFAPGTEAARAQGRLRTTALTELALATIPRYSRVWPDSR